MFERYTESARRLLFFARYEASQSGAISIETEHLLLGLTHEYKGLVAGVLGSFDVTAERIRRDVENRLVFREKVSTSVEMPFTAATQRVLHLAAAKADGLGHGYIGTEHLLLALLREGDSGAAAILGSYGLKCDEVRTKIVELLGEPSGSPKASTAAAAIAHIDALTILIEQFTEMPSGSSEARGLAQRIYRSLDELKRHVGS